MAIKLSTAARNVVVNHAINTHFNGATLNIYTGSAPSTADAAPSGTLLVTIGGISYEYESATNGTAYLAESYTAEATEAGVAGYARMLDTWDTDVGIQGNVGTAATCDFVIDKGTFGIENVTLTAATITYPES